MSNPWNEYLAEYRMRHPEMSLKDAMKNASKTYEKKVRRSYKISQCPSHKLRDECDSDKECKWNSSKEKCYKKAKKSVKKVVPKVVKVVEVEKPKRHYERSYCPSYVLQEACDMDEICKWNWKDEKCLKKKKRTSSRKVAKAPVKVKVPIYKPTLVYEEESSEDIPIGVLAERLKKKKQDRLHKKRDNSLDLLALVAAQQRQLYDEESEEESSEDIPLGVLAEQLKQIKKYEVNDDEDSSEDIPLGVLAEQLKQLAKKKRSYSKSECPNHKSSESCAKHEGCKWNTKKSKCYKKASRRRVSSKKSVDYSVEDTSNKVRRSYNKSDCPSHVTHDSCNHHEGCKWNSKKTKCYKKYQKKTSKK